MVSTFYGIAIIVIIAITLFFLEIIQKEPIVLNENRNNQDTLNRLAYKVDSLVDHMHKYAYPSGEVSKRLYNRWKTIRNDSDGLKEISYRENTAAYTISKSKIRICVKNKNNIYEDENTMMFVMLHELGHIMSESMHHTSEFKENFSLIVQKAIEMNLYRYEAFSSYPKNFCGVDIKNSPVNERGLRNW
jgi:hypothetical protein